MQKVYQRINWENDPSTNTPLSEDNLNKMDYALDQIDNRVVQLAGYQDRVAQSEKNAKTSPAKASGAPGKIGTKVPKNPTTKNKPQIIENIRSKTSSKYFNLAL